MLRAWFTIGTTPYLDEYLVIQAGRAIFSISLVGFACLQFKLSKEKLNAILGVGDRKSLLSGLGLGVILFMFALGQSAVTTLVAAQYDLEQAYRVWPFHPEPYGSHPLLSVHILIFITASVLLPAICEEIFFRGLFFPALSNKRTYLRSALICSAVFAMLHFQSLFNVLNSLIFSCIACCIYASGRSLYYCIVTHATYNFVAFIFQHYFDFHGTRSINQLSNVTDWIPQLIMFAVSIACLTGLALRYPPKRGFWLREPKQRVNFHAAHVYGPASP
ncbi:CPBP family intramembrane metalloprotease [Massilia sp. B-10]|nr:CPBP family intramembrane metalloprotease [Massilia sp. B-10]UUZ57306.1 CPBP family intramembrane metalloprotease [Massilia sp. H-1]